MTTALSRNSLRAALLCCLLLLACAAQSAPTFERVRAEFVSSDAQLLDRHGEPLQWLRVDATRRRLQWVPLADVSPALSRAVLAAEDRRFHEHRGVDWRALAAAAWHNIFNTRARGASTITMQLAGLLDTRLRGGSEGRGLLQKWRQARAALDIERHWSKPQILEAYLNLVSYRGELQGIDAAAQGLHGKSPSGLNNREAAVLAVLIRAPSASREKVAARACALVRAMQSPERCADVEWSAMQALARPRNAPTGIAQRVAEKLLSPASRSEGSRVVHSTLDAGLQRFVIAQLQQQLADLRGRNVDDAAALVLDNATGEILAYVPNGGGGSEVDGVVALRQAGSTLKPFLYQLALEKRQLTAASLLDDSPLDIATPAGLYVPQNYDRSFRGLASVRVSLGSSLNVPAVRTLVASGVDPFLERLRELGFTSLTESADHYGYALALGGADVALLELTNAYRALANLGAWSPAAMQRSEAAAESRRAMDPAASFIVADILGDNGARNVAFGLDSALATPYWSAVKTGTSKDMRDNWCIGFSARYTVGVWVGNFDGEPMWDVSGVTGAAPLWRRVMDRLHASAPSIAPPAPDGVVAQQVSFASAGGGTAIESARREWFVAGTEASVIEALADADLRPRIRYPGNGTIIALDPDIPLDNQRVSFQARRGTDLFWQLDGVLLASADRSLTWRPRAGKHRLMLVDENDTVRDEVGFEVRGSDFSR